MSELLLKNLEKLNLKLWVSNILENLFDMDAIKSLVTASCLASADLLEHKKL